VRDVEEAGALSDGLVLGLDALVLDGHLVSGEGDEAGAGLRVLVVERGPFEGLVSHRLPPGLELAGGAGLVEAAGWGVGRGLFEVLGSALGELQRAPTKSSRVSLDSVSVGSMSMASFTTRGK
jgi:hypothetical protein